MKLLAKNHVWWPGIGEDIEEFVNNCKVCKLLVAKPLSSGISSWPKSEFFFQRVHMDFFYFRNKNFLLIVDSYSKWIDIKEMNNTKIINIGNKAKGNFLVFWDTKYNSV